MAVTVQWPCIVILCAGVCSGVQWRAMVCSGVQWRAMVCNGVQWCAVVCSGVRGCTLLKRVMLSTGCSHTLSTLPQCTAELCGGVRLWLAVAGCVQRASEEQQAADRAQARGDMGLLGAGDDVRRRQQQHYAADLEAQLQQRKVRAVSVNVHACFCVVGGPPGV